MMMLAAGYGSEIEFFSLMPDEEWNHFIESLEALFFLVDEKGNKTNSYAPVERLLHLVQQVGGPCKDVHAGLRARAEKYNCAPFFQRIEKPRMKPRVEEALREFQFDSVDCSISYDSKDFSYAIRIYDSLIDRGLNVFLAGASLSKAGLSDFQLAIERALLKAKSMVLVASDPDHLEGGWVRAEWTTFLNEHRAGRKVGNLVTVRPPGMEITDLPLLLRMFQSEVIEDRGRSDPTSIDRLINFLGIHGAT